MKRIATHGLILAVGMMLFAAVTLGAFPFGGTMLVVSWMIVLIAIGIILRRTIWKDFRSAAKVVGIAMAFSGLAVFGLALVGDNLVPVWKALTGAWEVFAFYYLPFYWLPLGVGLLAGGLHRRNRNAEQFAAGNRP